MGQDENSPLVEGFDRDSYTDETPSPTSHTSINFKNDDSTESGKNLLVFMLPTISTFFSVLKVVSTIFALYFKRKPLKIDRKTFFISCKKLISFTKY